VLPPCTFVVMVVPSEAALRLVHDLAPEPAYDCSHVVWSDHDNSSQSSFPIGGESGDLSSNHGLLDVTEPFGGACTTSRRGLYAGMPVTQFASMIDQGLNPERSKAAFAPWIDGLTTDVRSSLPAEHVTHGGSSPQPGVLKVEASIGVGAGSLPPRVKKHSKSTNQDHVLFSTSSSELSAFSESERGLSGPSSDVHVRPEGPPVAGGLEASPPEEMAATCIGSALHASGGCRPCLFYASEVGCREQENCLFCHSPHKGKNRPHPSKKMRARYRKLILQQQERTEQEKGADAELRELLQKGEVLSM